MLVRDSYYSQMGQLSVAWLPLKSRVHCSTPSYLHCTHICSYGQRQTTTMRGVTGRCRNTTPQHRTQETSAGHFCEVFLRIVNPSFNRLCIVDPILLRVFLLVNIPKGSACLWVFLHSDVAAQPLVSGLETAFYTLETLLHSRLHCSIAGLPLWRGVFTKLWRNC